MKQLETLAQTKRYSRQIMLPAIDLAGQERLLNSKVLLIGVGGLGCAAAPYLISAGVGELTLVDGDLIDLSNLQRQILFTEADIGQAKARVAAARLAQLQPEAVLHVVAEYVDAAQISALVAAHDVVLDCTDNLATRLAISDACVAHRRPLVSGSAIRFEGQLCCFSHQADGPCYRCLSQMFGEQTLNCLEAGIFAPVVGVIGTSQASLALQILAKVGTVPWHQLRLYDGLTQEWQSFLLRANPRCQCRTRDEGSSDNNSCP